MVNPSVNPARLVSVGIQAPWNICGFREEHIEPDREIFSDCFVDSSFRAKKRPGASCFLSAAGASWRLREKSRGRLLAF